jgi:hypothetical protein
VLTWAKHGSESIQAEINGNEKDCVTVLASVTAVGAKILHVFIAVGKRGASRNHRSETSRVIGEPIQSVVEKHPTHFKMISQNVVQQRVTGQITSYSIAIPRIALKP